MLRFSRDKDPLFVEIKKCVHKSVLLALIVEGETAAVL